MRTRRQIVLGAAAAVASTMIRPIAAAASSDWRRISSSDAGFASDLEARLDNLVTSGRAWNLHGVVILRKGGIAEGHIAAGDLAGDALAGDRGEFGRLLGRHTTIVGSHDDGGG